MCWDSIRLVEPLHLLSFADLAKLSYMQSSPIIIVGDDGGVDDHMGITTVQLGADGENNIT